MKLCDYVSFVDLLFFFIFLEFVGIWGLYGRLGAEDGLGVRREFI